MGAPVCHISVDETITQPDPKSLPSIPQATDLASALAAINAMRQWLIAMQGGSSPSSNHNVGFSVKGAKIKTNKPKPKPPGYFEIKRVTEKVKIYDPADFQKTGPYIEVERINMLELRNKVTGDVWVWERTQPGN